MKHIKIKHSLFVFLFAVVIICLYEYLKINDFQINKKDKEKKHSYSQKNIINPEKIKFLDNSITYSTLPNFCENYLNPIESFKVWKKEKLSLIKDIYKELDVKNIDIKKIDYISELSGIGFMKGRIFSKYQNVKGPLPLLADQNSEMMSEQEQERLSELLNQEKYTELTQAFSRGDISLNKYGLISWKILPPISHILNQESGQIGQKIVLNLISFGAKPTFIDLVTATKLNLPVRFVAQMYSSNLGCRKTPILVKNTFTNLWMLNQYNIDEIVHIDSSKIVLKNILTCTNTEKYQCSNIQK